MQEYCFACKLRECCRLELCLRTNAISESLELLHRSKHWATNVSGSDALSDGMSRAHILCLHSTIIIV